VFILSAVIAIAAGLAARFILAPLRRNHIESMNTRAFH